MKKNTRRRRRWWMLSLNRSRSRMSMCDFEYLLNKLGPYITKKDTPMRKGIPAAERLAVTLRFLATGESFVSLSYLFKMSNQIVSEIVHEVCRAIIKVLKDEIQSLV
ncbi:hypothetical protein NQ318_005593 [Aromia moschata]|uniref:Protein ANTAGONIST OF LIKE HETEROCHROMATIN PROTEIN 1-like n=1 Tax=Aromia moschata TaxID=1265417 RepID=A0AAV8X8H1_9CUCU|nr:hypothetical protein NQ318_005593 [Aromia moschata]